MKGKSPEEQSVELQRAKEAMKVWMMRERRWDFRQIRRWCPEPRARFSLLTRLQQNGYFIVNPPDEKELKSMKEAAGPAVEEAVDNGDPRPDSASVEKVSARVAESEKGKQKRPGACVALFSLLSISSLANFYSSPFLCPAHVWICFTLDCMLLIILLIFHMFSFISSVVCLFGDVDADGPRRDKHVASDNPLLLRCAVHLKDVLKHVIVNWTCVVYDGTHDRVTFNCS